MNWSNIFLKSVFVERVKLNPRDFHAGYASILEKTLKDTFEGKCSKYGYMKKGSIELIQVYMGTIESQTFRGYVNFHVKFSAEVCNPTIGSHVIGKVQNINSFGILCTCGYMNEAGPYRQYVPILEIIIPKHSQSIKSETNLGSLRIGDEVNIEIVGKKFELNDTKISSIGKIVKVSKTKSGLFAADDATVLEDDNTDNADNADNDEDAVNDIGFVGSDDEDVEAEDENDKGSDVDAEQQDGGTSSVLEEEEEDLESEPIEGGTKVKAAKELPDSDAEEEEEEESFEEEDMGEDGGDEDFYVDASDNEKD